LRGCGREHVHEAAPKLTKNEHTVMETTHLNIDVFPIESTCVLTTVANKRRRRRKTD
jgi:hypothetical protein